jgi:uncharacterized membrane protein YfcA
VLYALLAGLGFGGAFLSGLVGVGGAIVMIPLLLYVPPLFGFEAFGIKVVAGITMVQVFAAAIVGLLGHRAAVDRSLFLALGPVMVVASFAGAFASGAAPPIVLELVFAVLATIAAVLMLTLRGRTVPETDGPLAFNTPVAAVAGTLVGFSAGLIGAGGAFFLIPVMLYGLRIPVRVTVGTSLAVVAASAAAGLLGKVVANQVDWALAVALVAGALPGAWLGAVVSKRTRTDALVVVLGVAIAVVAVRVWLDVAGQVA